MVYSDIVSLLYHLSFEITVKENNDFFLLFIRYKMKQ